MFPFIQIASLQIPTYPLVISLSFSIGMLWSFKKSALKGLSRKTLLDMSLGLMVGGLAGARMLHVLYEAPSYYLENPLQILMIWNGGFVFYGGAVGGFLGALVLLKIKGESEALWADFLAPIGAFCYGLGRVGCFLAGCCYGQISSLPWAVSFPGLTGARHPTQLYATVLEWGICGLLLFLERKKSFVGVPGRLFFTWVLLHSMVRLFMEALRDDFRGPLLLGWSLSQVISGCLLLVGLWGLTRCHHRAVK